MTIHLKDPDATVDYLIDWGARLDGRAVTESDWAVAPAEPGGLVIADDAIDGARTRARLSGGVPGHVYRATCQVVLSDGGIDERSLALRVEQR
ncbi:phage fiber-tail adaptor protein [Sphingomonas sp. KC8]|uniref:phage fiber-tail adaptor protein n=1 Tax=Sphingomonas sp. KC8 TaxID=1030157 RepID=UPI0002489BB9|nr:hypothetical protein [Sphingomonas sp. KC8]ARS29114.1 hypothetical protein KC8_17730 [Sphingomonas sp. KC8]